MVVGVVMLGGSAAKMHPEKGRGEGRKRGAICDVLTLRDFLAKSYWRERGLVNPGEWKPMIR